MGNAYLDAQKKREQEIFNAGIDVGYQRCLDYMQIILRNPDYVKKDIFGRERWEILYKALAETDDEFGDAYTMRVNADVCQERMDSIIREIFGKDTMSFAERYPMIKKFHYGKAMKGWK